MSAASRQQELGADHVQVRARVCVIGAGLAGLVAASRVAAALQGAVVVLESGTLAPDPDIAGLDAVDNPGGSYLGTLRSRGLGGTSALWAGKLLPLSPHDIAARPHVGLDQWPIEPAALARYTSEIEALFGINHAPYDGAGAHAFDPHGHLPASPDGITWRWPKLPIRKHFRIDHVLREELTRLDNLTIWTGATATGFALAEGRLATVTATNHRGGALVIEADHFILAAGTLETTRLLLLADAQNEGCISRTTDALGRYFNDHYGVDVAIVRPRRTTAANQAFADRKIGGTKRHLHGELSEAVQRDQAVGSAYFDFDLRADPDSALSAARAAVSSIREGRSAEVLRHLPHMLAGLAPLARVALWLGVHGQQYWPPDADLRAKIWIEQLPRYGNRLTLGSRVDSLGQPALHGHIARTDEDERTARTMVDELGRLWDRQLSPLASLEWSLPPSGRLIDTAAEQAHPAGSTRMGLDPARSVVDPALRVHAVPNIHIASASAFPSSGSANPTFTILQLAMLAADTVLAQQCPGDDAYALQSPPAN